MKPLESKRRMPRFDWVRGIVGLVALYLPALTLVRWGAVAVLSSPIGILAFRQIVFGSDALPLASAIATPEVAFVLLALMRRTWHVVCVFVASSANGWFLYVTLCALQENLGRA
jgi:hypothetical protein